MNNWWKIRRFGSLLILGLVFGLAPQSLQAGGVVYVVPGGAGSQTGNDWSNAKDLQIALQTSPPGTEFWVKQGTYLPTIHESRLRAFTPPNGSRLFGGFTGDETSRHARNPSQNLTILSGDLLGNDMGAASQSNPTRSDNSYQVIYCLSQTNPIVLDGFVISGGQAVEVQGSHDGGGGLWAEDCTITIINSRIISNVAIRGGGIFNRNSTITVRQSIFAGNWALQHGGGIVSYQTGVYNLQSTTFVGNTNNIASAIAHNGDMLNLHNSIVWGNHGDMPIDINGPSTVSYSIVQGGFVGTGNSPNDPQFVDSDGTDNVVGTLDDNLNVQANSAARNTANASLLPSDQTDLDGDNDVSEAIPLTIDYLPRINEGLVDIGPYEYQGIEPTTTPTATATPSPTPTATVMPSETPTPTATTEISPTTQIYLPAVIR